MHEWPVLLESYGLLAMVGLVGGVISGLVGLAGGIFIVPALVAIYGVSAMADAIVVSYFAVLFNSMAASRTNLQVVGQRAYLALIKNANTFILSATTASILIAIAFGHYKNVVPKQLLAGLQLMLALCMLLPRAWYEKTKFRPNNIKNGIVGAFVGGISTLIGVGGGTYTIFYFLIHGWQIRNCTLIANFVGIFIGLASIMGYFGYVFFTPAEYSNTGQHTIDAMGKVILIIAGMFAAPSGVKLQSVMPARMIKRLIVVMLAISSSYVMFA